jgi:hypothetical protein
MKYISEENNSFFLSCYRVPSSPPFPSAVIGKLCLLYRGKKEESIPGLLNRLQILALESDALLGALPGKIAVEITQHIVRKCPNISSVLLCTHIVILYLYQNFAGLFTERGNIGYIVVHTVYVDQRIKNLRNSKHWLSFIL